MNERMSGVARSKPHIQRAQPYDHDDGWICYGGPVPDVGVLIDPTPEQMWAAIHGGVGVGETPGAAWRHWCAMNFGD